MLFVSRHANFKLGIRPDTSEIMTISGGRQVLRSVVPALNADFAKGALTMAARDAAYKAFNAINPDDPFGAIPYTQSGMITGLGIAYEGYEPLFALSKFDTDTDIDYNDAQAYTQDEKDHIKEIFEQGLLESPELNRAYVLIEEPRTPAPWPTYDDMTTRQIAAMVKQGGFNLDHVMAYEIENQARPELVEYVSSEKAKTQAQKDAEAAKEAMLTTEIPA